MVDSQSVTENSTVRSDADRSSHRGRRKTAARVKIHDCLTFVADVGLYPWDQHRTISMND